MNESQLNFEAAMAQLEQTVQQLETENLSLEQMLALYQDGMTLSKHCQTLLEQAELKVKMVTQSGQLVDFGA